MTKGDIYTVAGNGTDNTKDHCTGGLATGRAVPQASVAIDGSGNLLITSNDQVCLVPARSGTFYGQAMTAGHLYALAGDGTRGYSGDGGPASSAELSPGDATVDREGNLVIADTQNDRIRVVAESPGTFYGQAMTAGDIYTVAGNGTPGSIGNGGPATSAEFFFPRSVTVDGAGNLVICDSGNGLIRVVAESSARFYGRAMTAGDIYTVAGDGSGEGYTGDGGPATSASLEDPNSVAVDGAGNLVIADEVNLRVRVVAESPGTFYGVAMTASDIYTVAGDGTYGYTGDGGPGISAAIGSPMGVAVSPAGNLLIADGTNRVRELTG
jgi:sugar lactone lactonase YvrE